MCRTIILIAIAAATLADETAFSEPAFLNQEMPDTMSPESIFVAVQNTVQTMKKMVLQPPIAKTWLKQHAAKLSSR